jgi:hypothetical protein
MDTIPSSIGTGFNLTKTVRQGRRLFNNNIYTEV